MSNIEELMSKCPLKHHIRVELWEKYILKLRKKPIKYLTLYCPPLMDVKHFSHQGLIDFHEKCYKGVVAVTNDQEGYARTISQGRGRLDLLKLGTISELLEKRDRDLITMFPFDVINLDYCNYLYPSRNSPYVSDNLSDTNYVIKMQRKRECNEFVLFMTTRTDVNEDNDGFAESFIDDLCERIQNNLDCNQDFSNKYAKAFGSITPKILFEQNYSEFIAIGIVKLISMNIATFGYTINNCDAFWLQKSASGRIPQRDLLHLAFHIKRGKTFTYKPSTRLLREVGKVFKLESGAIAILDRVIDAEIKLINEKNDGEILNRKYSKYISELKNNTFELRTPTPESIT